MTPSSPHPSKLISLPNDRRQAYSDRTAWILASCSKLAYDLKPSKETGPLEKGLQPFGLKLAQAFYCSKNQNAAYLAVHKTYAVLAFKGTVPSEPETVATDLHFMMQPFKYRGEVHEGFKQTADELKPQIEKALRKIKTPVFITGHSLGGALALLSSILLNGPEPFAACYTYGCPRVGNDVFAGTIFKVPVYRCVHRIDIVPSVPFLWMDFRHYGDVRFLNDNITVCEGSEAIWMRFLAHWNPFNWFSPVKKGQSIWNPFNWLSLIADHSIERYGEILLAFAAQRNP